MDTAAPAGPRATRSIARIVAAAFVAVLAAPAFATEIGPNNRYIATDQVTYSFTDISSTGTRVLSNTDDTSTNRNIGFTFAFYGANFTQVSVSSNGMLTFGATNNAYANTNLTTTGTTNNRPSIAVYWDDLDFRTSNDANADGVYVQTIGTTVGQRTFVIQWNQASHYPVNGVTFSGEVTFQAILYEGSNSILLNYQDLTWSTSGYDYGASATVGIRDTSGQTNGRRLQWSYNSGVLANNYSILYFTPEPGTVALYGLGVVGLLAGICTRRRKRREAFRGDARKA
jgi:hypothetical protein